MKAQLEYLNKKTQKKEKTFDVITRAARFIGRANDRSKSIGNKNTKFLLAYLTEQINRSKNKIIFMDHEDISSITECRPNQNLNIMKHLTDIFEFEYHRFIRFEGQKKYYGYTIKFTHDGKARLNNPESFYPQLFQKEFQINTTKNYETSHKKLGDTSQKIVTHPTKNCDIYTYNDFDYDKNTKDDLGDHVDLSGRIHTSVREEGYQNQQDQFKNVANTRSEEEITEEAYQNQQLMNLIQTIERNKEEVEPLDTTSLKDRASKFLESCIPSPAKTKDTAPPLPILPNSYDLSKPQIATASASTNVSYPIKYLRDYKLNQESFDLLRASSNKPHFTNDRIIAIIQNILEKKPDTTVWGGKKAFTNFMVKALNNEREYTEEENTESIAEIERKKAEEARYCYENKIIIWG